MKLTKELTKFEELKLMVWSGAVKTLDVIEREGKQDELMMLLDEIFFEGATETEVNDYLWFDDHYIYDDLGIDYMED